MFINRNIQQKEGELSCRDQGCCSRKLRRVKRRNIYSYALSQDH